MLSGNGFIGVHDGYMIRLIDTQTGAITNRPGVASLDAHPVCGNGSFNGIIEATTDGLHVIYAATDGIVRTRHSDAATMLLLPLATDSSCSIALLPRKKRWVTHSTAPEFLAPDAVPGEAALLSCPAVLRID